MSDPIQFVSNYTDHSTTKGYQFEFHCDHCGTGYRTTFKPSLSGTVNTALEAASSIFGGIFNNASNLGNQAQSATWQKAHDDAFIEATKEIKPQFRQCPKCRSWVCRASCWNDKKELCKNCAPDLGVEMAAAQASKSVEEVWAHAAMAEEDKHLTTEDWRKGIKASCPECEAPLATNAKFCPECGAKINAEQLCTKCQAKLTPGAKFCPECGEKQ